jgi:ribose 5-phosphate isomerase B
MIAIGNDHTGYELKKAIIEYLEEKGLEYKDFGCGNVTSSDYPEYAKVVGSAIQNKECDKGILICGTGIGISITANKMKGIRAALCHDCFSAEATRQHNDANVLAMGARVIGTGHALKIVEIFLNTEFSGAERHKRRIHMMEED